ncbi:universal stress protein [Peterkaempfera sp. SMS 1(5)a]|uniref:universal stress protein n=1 Tax=Peterkaempfera podocarpi TaxID=3232308 RepID=UPI00366ABFA8
MPRAIVVGLDASPESAAAADWAAGEAVLRGLPVELVQGWPRPPFGGPHQVEVDSVSERWGRRVLDRMELELRTRHDGVEVTALQVPRPPVDVLSAASHDAVMLVLGSRALGAVRGSILGSVSQAVLVRAACPVVLVRSEHRASAEHVPDDAGLPSVRTSFRPVVLGLDIRRACDDVLAFAFEEAALRSAPLHVAHAGHPSVGLGYAAPPLSAASTTQFIAEEEHRAAATLRPWREKYPQVETDQRVIVGSAARFLVEAVPAAGLMVVGRRIREPAICFHIGPVCHAVIHHAACPVAVVPYR